MSKQQDSLVVQFEPDRVHYATGVLLNAEDFLAEQNYHRGRLARALSYLHGYGTASGLRVVHENEMSSDSSSSDSTAPDSTDSTSEEIVTTGSPVTGIVGGLLGVFSDVASDAIESTPSTSTPDLESVAQEEKITVLPGLAVDRLGRLIEMTKPFCLRLNRWFESQNAEDLERGRHEGLINAVVVDVFIRFVTCERGKTPSFATGPFNSLDAVVASRLRDSFELFLVIRPKDLALPEPVSPWNELADIPKPQREDKLQDAILDSWHEGTESSDINGLVPLVEHAGVDDTTSILLARIEIPAVRGEGSGTGTATPRPVRTEGLVRVNNKLRPFIVSADALAQWMWK